ncbi:MULTISPECIES: hypothetical protein [Bacillaceae]|uniref:Uncharacterized protein n=1 Tax=Evansella alkalicola TaxID=745819 RepID=A0ABS6JZY5_9BACI|nr:MULTISPECIES: hypothetical protein [Bacillaceae]MBU9724023.1 hypothetical protein [Bacillus alkalicola]
MNHLKTISMFQMIIIILLLVLMPFILAEANINRSSFSISYGYEILPQLMAFVIGFLLLPHKTEQLLLKNINYHWSALTVGGIIFCLSWVPFILLLDSLAIIFPAAFIEFQEVRFIIFVIGGLLAIIGLVGNKEKMASEEQFNTELNDEEKEQEETED